MTAASARADGKQPAGNGDSVRAYLRHALSYDKAAFFGNLVLSTASALSGNAAIVLAVRLLQVHGPAAPDSAQHGSGLLGAWSSPSPDFRLTASIFLAASFIFSALRWLTAYYNARLVGAYAGHMRSTTYAHLLRARLIDLADRTSAGITNLLTYNAETLVAGLSGVLQLAVASMTALIGIATAVVVAPGLTLAALALRCSRPLFRACTGAVLTGSTRISPPGSRSCSGSARTF